MPVDDPETFAIVGAAIQVHRTMGGSLLEAVYVRALAIEFREREVPFVELRRAETGMETLRTARMMGRQGAGSDSRI